MEQQETKSKFNNQEFFAGKLSNFVDRYELNFEKKHAKAHLKGHQFFRHGYFRDKDGAVKPQWFETKRSDTQVL